MRRNVFIKREYDYAIRICAYLAGRNDGTPVPIPEVARKLFITRPVVHKIVNHLKKNGILLTVQGKQGGILLAQKPDTVSLLDVLKAMGFSSTLNECLVRPSICPLVATCHIHEFFLEQERSLLKNLEEKTLADFAFSDKDLEVHHKQSEAV